MPLLNSKPLADYSAGEFHAHLLGIMNHTRQMRVDKARRQKSLKDAFKAPKRYVIYSRTAKGKPSLRVAKRNGAQYILESELKMLRMQHADDIKEIMEVILKRKIEVRSDKSSS